MPGRYTAYIGPMLGQRRDLKKKTLIVCFYNMCLSTFIPSPETLENPSGFLVLHNSHGFSVFLDSNDHTIIIGNEKLAGVKKIHGPQNHYRGLRVQII